MNVSTRYKHNDEMCILNVQLDIALAVQYGFNIGGEQEFVQISTYSETDQRTCIIRNLIGV